MFYENYQNRILKFASARDNIIKHRKLIFAVLAVIFAAILACLIFKGTFTSNLTLEAQFTYGETVECSASAVFSKINYQYRKKGESSWTDGKPTIPGDYEIRAVSSATFGIKKYSEPKAVSVLKRDITVVVDEDSIVYGEFPTLKANFAYDDVISNSKDAIDLSEVADYKQTAEPVSDRIVIKNSDGKIVNDYYNISVVSKSIAVLKREVAIDISDAEKVYDGIALTSSEYEIASGSTAFDDEINLEFANQQINVGSTPNTPIISAINSENIDVSDYYDFKVQTGNLTITPRIVSIKSFDAQKTYDGIALEKTDFEIVSSTNIVSGENAVVVSNSKQTDVGECENVLNFSILGSENQDLTLNYQINLVSGKLSVIERNVLVSSDSASKVYDGTPLFCDNYTNNGNLVEGHSLSLASKTEITNVSTVENSIRVEVFSGNINVSANYDIEYEFGTLEITKRSVELKPKDATKVYDGFALISNTAEVVSGSLAENQRVEITTSKSIEDVGTLNDNEILTVSYYNDLDEAVSSTNYLTAFEFGSLEITKRPISLLTESDSKEYDGIPLFNEEIGIESGSLCENQIFEVISHTEITEVSTAENILEFKITKNGVEKTANYNISLSYGKLEITKRNVTFKPDDKQKIYDGTALTTDSFSVIAGSLAPNQYAVVEIEGSQTEVGINDNVFISTFAIFDNDDNEINLNNYNVTCEKAKLEVFARPITLKTGSASKVYDGTELYSHGYELTEGSLVEGHTVEVSNYTTIVDVESCDNAFDVSIKFGAIEKTQNYDITYKYGTLEITERPITLSTANDSKVYDGTALYNSSYEITLGSLVMGHSINVLDSTRVIEVGTATNRIEVEIKQGYVDKTFNYEVTLQCGELEVTPRLITLKPQDAEKIYDGKPLVSNNVEVVSGSFAIGEYAEITTNKSIIGVGEVDDNGITSILIKNAVGAIDLKNYSITYETGKLKILPLPIKLKPQDASRMYDGTPLVSNVVEVVSGSFAVGEYAEITTSKSITNYGILNDNAIVNMFIYNTDEQDVDLSNYDIVYANGSLEIIKRQLRIKPENATKVYDNTPLVSNKIEIVSGSFAPNQYGKITTSGTLTDVGVNNNNEILTLEIFDANDQSVSLDNYFLIYELGKLTITKRPIEVSTGSASKVYDDTPLICEEYEILSENLVDGHTLSATNSSSIINVGSVENVVEFAIMEGVVEKTNNYLIIYSYGTLEITARPLEITTGSASKTYDGFALLCADFEITSGSVVEGHNISRLQSTSNTIVGKVENEMQFTIKKGEVEKTSNYDISLVKGYLEITKREITITTDGLSKVYDGVPLMTQGYNVTVGSIASSDEIIIDSVVSITNVGSCENVLGLHIAVSSGEFADDDRTDCYDITMVYGELVVSPRPITVKPRDELREYDGTPLISYVVEVVEGSFANGERAQIETTKSIIDVGIVNDNEISSIIIKNSRNVEVPLDNYDITYQKGVLEVIQRAVTIKPKDALKIYDGEPLTSNEVDFVEGSAAINQHFEIETDGTQTRVGINEENAIVSFVIKDVDDNEINADNYLVTTEKGSLTITARPITIATSSASKVYDGLPLFNEEYSIVSGSLVDGDELEIISTTIINEVSLVDNEFVVSILKGSEDISDCYIVSTNCGTLEITARELTITTGSASKVYDGTDLICDEYELTAGTLVGSQTLDIAVYARITNVGVIDNESEFMVSLGGEDKTHNYSFTINAGTLEVKIRSISILSATESKTYDGTPLSSEEFEITSGSACLGQGILVDTNTEITNVGSAQNVITVKITQGSKNVSSNYQITYSYGILEVFAREITVKPKDETKSYDGEKLVSDELEFSMGSLAENQMAEFETSKELIDVGFLNDNEVINLSILDKDGNSAISNYIVGYEMGSLEITQRAITVKPKNAKKEYDGTQLVSNEPQITSGSLVSGHTIEIITNGSQTEVGVNKNNEIISCIIYYANGDEVDLNNYQITFESGKLEVIPLPLTIITGSDSKVYDGAVLNCRDYEIASGRLLSGDEIVISSSAEITNVGTMENSFIYTIQNSGVDKSANYEVELIEGLLQIVARPLVIKSASESWIYDGTTHSNKNYTIISGSTADGDVISVINNATIKDVGIIDNEIELTIKNGTKSVIKNYSIDLTFGLLEVTARQITITTASDSKVYDSLKLENKNYNLTNGTLIAGDEISILSNSSITEVGSTQNVFEISIMRGLDNVVDNYDVSFVNGTLAITPRIISIKPKNANKEYDGTPLTASEIEFIDSSETLCENHVINYVLSGSQTIIGTSLSSILRSSIVIVDDNGDDVTSNYEINLSNGTLRVTKIVIVFTPINITKTYSGLEITSSSYRYSKTGELLEGDSVVLNVEGAAVNVGTVPLSITNVVITNENGVNVTDVYYDVSTTQGSLTIIPKKITITSETVEINYNGDVLSSINSAESCYISVGSIISGQYIEYAAVINSIDTVGQVENTIGDIKVYYLDAYENKFYVTDNYEITYNPGMLIVYDAV